MITLYGVRLSVHVRKTIIACLHKGLEYRVEPVVPFNPPPGWTELSPTGLIPVMQDGDFTLSDSTAICLYLERAKPGPGLLPADPQAYGRALWFDAYAGTVFRNLVRDLFFQKVIGPRLLQQETDEAVVTRVLNDVRPGIFDYLESQAGGAFLAGDTLSLGDIAVVSNLINYQYLGFAIDPASHPRLAAYARRIIALPMFQRALAEEQPFTEQFGLDRSFLTETLAA